MQSLSLHAHPPHLEPEEEVLIGQYFKEEYGSDFVFVTHYPSKKRPFYPQEMSEKLKNFLSKIYTHMQPQNLHAHPP